MCAANDSTLDPPIYPALAGRLEVVELVVWDSFNNCDFGLTKCVFCAVSLFLPLRHASLQFFTLDLVSTRAGTPTAGKITTKLGFATASTRTPIDFDGELFKNSRPSLVSAAARSCYAR